MSLSLTPEERAQYIASGALKPATTKPKRSPAFMRYSFIHPSRKQTLELIEAELREKMARIEGKEGWKESTTLNASHFAYSEALRIVRSYSVISGGKPVGGGL